MFIHVILGLSQACFLGRTIGLASMGSRSLTREDLRLDGSVLYGSIQLPVVLSLLRHLCCSRLSWWSTWCFFRWRRPEASFNPCLHVCIGGQKLELISPELVICRPALLL